MGCISSDTRERSSAIRQSDKGDIDDAIGLVLNQGEKEGLMSQGELHLSCTQLKKMDVGSLTNSACVVHLKDNK